jgi:hypothetical protein
VNQKILFFGYFGWAINPTKEQTYKKRMLEQNILSFGGTDGGVIISNQLK